MQQTTMPDTKYRISFKGKAMMGYALYSKERSGPLCEGIKIIWEVER